MEKQCCHVRVRISLETELDLYRGAARLQLISNTVPVLDIFYLKEDVSWVDTRNE